jgi:hypothetical protein
MPRESAPGIGVIRAAAQTRADGSSLRTVAKEIGLSYTGLRAFLRGGKPQAETRRRLVAWYGRLKSGSASYPSPELAVDLLLNYIRQAGTPQLIRERIEDVGEALASQLTDGERSLVVPSLVEALTRKEPARTPRRRRPRP